VRAALDQLVASLLYEGYALYPYTPGATKNATPTPFGIVYPPAYAERLPTAFDHLRLECVLAADEGAELEGEVRFLQVAGERHQAVERRLELPRTPLAELIGVGVGQEFELEGDRAVRGRVRMRAEASPEPGLTLVRVCVHNTTELDPTEAEALDRPGALRASLLSTHVVIEVTAGRFVSPLERDGPAAQACRNVNTWPVLAAPDDDAILAAPIVLPDHPRIAPESLGNLFDNTEIEEALLLHVQALSDDEREQVAAQDPAVREMLERAGAATPERFAALHGRLEHAPPAESGPPSDHAPQQRRDPGYASEPGHPNPGEQTLEIDGVRFHKGGKVVLRPGTDRDVYDRMLDGRRATIERLYIDYEDGAHIAVTVDDDPAQELFRETGRYLFFKAGELEAVGQ
jgi:hypothetical protein